MASATLSKPIQLSGELFEAVQNGKVFSDCKTFVDSYPRKNPEIILKEYQTKKNDKDFDLAEFIKENFEVPSEQEVKEIKHEENMLRHINNLWDILTRKPDAEDSEYSSLIPLPYSYIVPGGRFREIYYWDSFFTSEGLAISGKMDMVENMIKNFAYLIEKFGHIPNGNRLYYLSRSQPPFFCCLVDLLARYLGNEKIKEYIRPVEKEYEFWMASSPSNHRRIEMKDGYILSRYWDDNPAPREESHREDMEIAQKNPQLDRKKLFTDIRAGAESGWDFSSRWFQDGMNMKTIRTTDILPVDLNCLLYNIEIRLSEWLRHFKKNKKSNEYRKLAITRKRAINKYFWNEKEGFYFDCTLDGKMTGIKSLAALYPLYFNIAHQDQADKVAEMVKKEFLYPGGVPTTLTETGQQWDKPNGWAPLQWITVKGLVNYGHTDLAEEIAARFLNLAQKVYTETGKMMEKYNVCDINLPAGGGEYPLQDGFGWTNGVILALSDSE